MYIVLKTSAPIFYCFNNTQGTDRDHVLTHIAAGLATLCKSPVLDRKKVEGQRGICFDLGLMKDILKLEVLTFCCFWLQSVRYEPFKMTVMIFVTKNDVYNVQGIFVSSDITL